jgi:valyl-tRNA synthetase
LRLSNSRVETCRNFGTKLWNATRFCEMNQCVVVDGFAPESAKQTVNRWILGETSRVAGDVVKGLESYRFNDAAGALYHFVYDVFCDWYLEISKPVLNGSDEAAKAETRATAAFVRDQILKLLHPFMPFITEELWARTDHKGFLMEAAWPDLSGILQDEAAREEMEWLIALVSGVRSVRAEMNVPPSAKIALILKGASAETKARLAKHLDVTLTLARLSEARADETIPQGSAQFVVGEAVAALPLGDVIDFAKERARLQKDMKKADEEIGRFDAKLNNETFVSRAPEEVIEEQREKRAEALALKARLEEALSRLN